MQPNEFGEIRLHVALPALPDGEYAAEVKLVDAAGAELAYHLYADVAFAVAHAPPGDAGAGSGGEEARSARVLATDDVGAVSDDGGCPSVAAEARVCSISGAERDPLECGGRGRCEGGACVCVADFAGARCEHALLERPVFFPADPADPAHAGARCRTARVWDYAGARLTRRLLALARRRACDGAHVLVAEAPPHGLGTNVHYLSMLLGRALAEGRALALNGTWNYDACPPDPPHTGGGAGAGAARGFECHWQPLSACSAAEALAAGAALHRRDDEAASAAAPRAADGHWVPEEFRSPSLGVLWWRAQLVGFLLRPNAETEQRVRAAQNRLGWAPPVVGLQVRRGDSCEHAQSSAIRPGCQPVAAYLAHVRAMAARYGARTLFLATDDAAVVAEVAEGLATGGGGAAALRLAVLPLDRQLFASSLFIEYRLALGSPPPPPPPPFPTVAPTRVPTVHSLPPSRSGPAQPASRPRSARAPRPARAPCSWRLAVSAREQLYILGGARRRQVRGRRGGVGRERAGPAAPRARRRPRRWLRLTLRPPRLRALGCAQRRAPAPRAPRERRPSLLSAGLTARHNAGRAGRVPPYASVDYPYCSHFFDKRPIGKDFPPQFC